jgi:hypothetical protein
MRVPDEIRKTVLFIGIKNEVGEWDWRATGYLIALSDFQLHWSETLEAHGQQFFTTTTHPFRLLATAKHVAEKLEGKDFALKTMTTSGEPRIIEVHANQRWFYHPTEKDYVDAAVTVFFPPDMRELDLFTIQAELFADEKVIREADLGVGDEVFIAGLFSMVKKTARQHPIVRIGNLAMMPGERIPFKEDKLIDAYLVESRSVGGLSGSPVFVRATTRVDAGLKFKSGFALNAVNSQTPNIEGIERTFLEGVGRIYFLGSMIGHWNTREYPPEMPEVFNMGVSLVVPAHKILEIIRQPELIAMAENIVNEMRKGRAVGEAVLDFDEKEEKPFTQQDFESALRKVTRRVTPSESGEGTK